VTGCLRSTPADNLPILAAIQPAELHRIGTTLSLARRAMEPGHLLHSTLTCPSSNRDTHLYLVAQQLISSSDNEINSSAAQDSCQKLFKRGTLHLCRGAWDLKM